MSPTVHPTAVVADGAQLDEDVWIGPYCLVGGRVRLGARTRLVSHVVVEGDTWLGSDCEVFPHAVLGARPQDKKLDRETTPGAVRIGDRNVLREFVTVHAASPGGTTRVGNDNMLLASAHVGHDAEIGDGVVLTNASMAAGHTSIGDRSVLGAAVGLHQFARIGRLAMIGAGAMVSKDVPPFAMAQGDRARLRGVNVIGLLRAGFTADDVATIKRAFRQLFWRAGTLRQRLTETHRIADGNPYVEEIIQFIETTRRGVVMPRGEPFDDEAP